MCMKDSDPYGPPMRKPWSRGRTDRACLPAGFSISLKKAREITSSPSIDLMKTDKLLSLTGYVRGGVSPLGMKRRFPTFICDLAQLEDYVYVSGGLRGVSLKIRPSDLALACSGSFADFVQ